jgi:outer membrane lipoprotein SlyB
MEKDKQIINDLIAGGLVGAALGALLSNENETGNNAVLGAIAGAAMVATFRANEEAKKTNIPLILEENGNLYEVYRNGEKRFLKKLEKSQTKVPTNFKLL